MPIKAEGNYIGDVVKYEEFAFYSRKEITVASGAGVMKIGSVLGQIATGGKYVAANSGLGNGAQVAKAVLVEDIDASSGDVTATVIARHAIVNRSNLIWDASIDTLGERNTAVDELEAVGIIAREGA